VSVVAADELLADELVFFYTSKVRATSARI